MHRGKYSRPEWSIAHPAGRPRTARRPNPHFQHFARTRLRDLGCFHARACQRQAIRIPICCSSCPTRFGSLPPCLWTAFAHKTRSKRVRHRPQPYSHSNCNQRDNPVRLSSIDAEFCPFALGYFPDGFIRTRQDFFPIKGKYNAHALFSEKYLIRCLTQFAAACPNPQIELSAIKRIRSL
jgi:hypothetical protein